MDPKGDIAVIGLAVMGQNLILNMNDHGFTVVAHNRTTDKVDAFLANEAKGTNVIGAKSIQEMIANLKRPRRVMTMVKAGAAVDETFKHIIGFLEPGDILIDGGNSLYTDSNRRVAELGAKGILYVGAGVSGGEEGARNGPSIMPGGAPEAWPFIKPIFQGIAAKVEGDVPCCDWVGKGGSGHFVKMVHNGIEYGDMQLICEAYAILKQGLGLTNPEMVEIFDEWNKTELNSYLIEITRDILGYKEADGGFLVDKILDAAGQKGTGKWTVEVAMDLGIPITLISEAVFARTVSSMKSERVAASKVLSGPSPKMNVTDKKAFVEAVKYALYASKIISYTQGYMLFRAASKEFKWDLNFGGIALMWRGGCIIRSGFLGKIKDAFDRDANLTSLLMDPFFKGEIERAQAGWRQVVAAAVTHGIPVPAFSTALSFYDSYRAETLPANLLQAQRDYFGAHTYERTDGERGDFHHTNWTGRGGNVSSTVYKV